MGPLNNQRHERFAQGLFQGKSADEAYVLAGYQENRGNASRLKANESVMTRLSELQSEMAKETEVTVASLLAELEDARQKATSLDQMSAVVKAVSEKAKISGLLVQKVEVGAAGDFSNCETIEAIAAQTLKYIGNSAFKEIREKDHQGLVAMMKRHFAEQQEYIDAIAARPIAYGGRLIPEYLPRLPAKGPG